MTLLIAIALAATAPAELVQQGDHHDVRFQPKQALECYLAAEKNLPADAALKIKIARQYIYCMKDLRGDDDKIASARAGLSYAEEAVKLAPASADAHLAVAICLGKLTPLLGNKEMIEASRRIRDAAERAVKLNPKSDYAWHLLGRWHQGVAGIGGVTRALAKVIYGGIPQGSHDEAVRCFKKALEINPNRLIHHIELGRTYAAMGDATQARKFIERGLAMPNIEFDDPETKERGRAALESL